MKCSKRNLELVIKETDICYYIRTSLYLVQVLKYYENNNGDFSWNKDTIKMKRKMKTQNKGIIYLVHAQTITCSNMLE